MATYEELVNHQHVLENVSSPQLREKAVKFACEHYSHSTVSMLRSIDVLLSDLKIDESDLNGDLTKLFKLAEISAVRGDHRTKPSAFVKSNVAKR